MKPLVVSQPEWKSASSTTTPFGRQEEWEDSPEGTPHGPPYAWWREYGR